MGNRMKDKLTQVIRRDGRSKNKGDTSSEVISAARLVAQRHPEVVPTGYWIAGDAIVIMTKLKPTYRKALIPTMFAVTETGEVRGLTPMVYRLDSRDMKKIPRRSFRSK